VQMRGQPRNAGASPLTLYSPHPAPRRDFHTEQPTDDNGPPHLATLHSGSTSSAGTLDRGTSMTHGKTIHVRARTSGWNSSTPQPVFFSPQSVFYSRQFVCRQTDRGSPSKTSNAISICESRPRFPLQSKITPKNQESANARSASD